jgi:predicted NUDIX family phosphoesterase
MSALLDPRVFQFLPRSIAEHDPNYKQLIPYVVLKHRHEVFTYTRGTAGTEKRLTAKRSLGIGGHISVDDAMAMGDVYRTGMLRELHEEVELRCDFTETPIGFIYDDSTFVGSVHLGVVHLFELASGGAVPREDALTDTGFEPIADLKQHSSLFESWSQLVLAHL